MHDYLQRMGITTLLWNDGVLLCGKYQDDVPRDAIVLPWYYGGGDFSPARHYVDMGFRILCSPWSQWHAENDQFYSMYTVSMKSDKVLGMAGTVWYPIASEPANENDYRRCLVKSAMAFWSPLQAGDYPTDTSYYAPDYAGLPGDSLGKVKPLQLTDDERAKLIDAVTMPASDALACEAAPRSDWSRPARPRCRRYWTRSRNSRTAYPPGPRALCAASCASRSATGRRWLRRSRKPPGLPDRCAFSRWSFSPARGTWRVPRQAGCG